MSIWVPVVVALVTAVVSWAAVRLSRELSRRNLRTRIAADLAIYNGLGDEFRKRPLRESVDARLWQLAAQSMPLAPGSRPKPRIRRILALVAVVATRSPRWGAAIALAWASHVLFDWLSNDTRPPIGVMALWPFTRDYYKASFEIFPPVSRKYWESRFWIYNLRAVVMEMVILGPACLLALRWRDRRSQ